MQTLHSGELTAMVTDEGEGMSDVAGSRVSQLGPR